MRDIYVICFSVLLGLFATFSDNVWLQLVSLICLFGGFCMAKAELSVVKDDLNYEELYYELLDQLYMDDDMLDDDWDDDDDDWDGDDYPESPVGSMSRFRPSNN